MTVPSTLVLGSFISSEQAWAVPGSEDTYKIVVNGLPGIEDGTTFDTDSDFNAADLTIPDNYYLYSYKESSSGGGPSGAPYNVIRNQTYKEKPADFDADTLTDVKVYYTTTSEINYNDDLTVRLTPAQWEDRLTVAEGIHSTQNLLSLDDSLKIDIPGYQYDHFEGSRIWMGDPPYSPFRAYNSLKIYYTPASAAASPTLTMNSADTNSDTYSVYKLFNVDTVSVNEEGLKTASGIIFANNYMKDLAMSVYADDNDKMGTTVFNAGDNAQTKAEAIAANIKDGTALVNGDFGKELAKQVAYNVRPSTTINAGETIDIDDGIGYYLIVNQNSVEGVDTASSTPIFVLIGPGNNEINEKSALPSLHFFVQEDSKVGDENNGWGKEADDTTMKDINFKAVGTFPDNLDAYNGYTYTFHLTEAEDLSEPDNIKITIDGVEVPKEVSREELWSMYGDDGEYRFELNIDTIRNNDIEVNPDSVVVLEYTSHMNGKPAQVVSPVMELIYSNNPEAFGGYGPGADDNNSTGTTTPEKVDIYHYTLNIKKVDKNTGEALQGVGFTVKNKDGVYINYNEDEFDVNYLGVPEELIPADYPKTMTLYKTISDDELTGIFEDDYNEIPGYHVSQCWLSETVQAMYEADEEGIALMSMDDDGDVYCYQCDGVGETWNDQQTQTFIVHGITAEALSTLTDEQRARYTVIDDNTVSFKGTTTHMGWGPNADDPHGAYCYMTANNRIVVDFGTSITFLNGSERDQDARSYTIYVEWKAPKQINDFYYESTDAQIFYTDENGMIEIYGIDADEYIIEEVKALDNYDELGSTITVSYDTTDRTNILASITGDENLVSSYAPSDADASVLVKNIKQISLPSTGAAGLGILLLIAICLAIRSSMKRRQSEEAIIRSLD